MGTMVEAPSLINKGSKIPPLPENSRHDAHLSPATLIRNGRFLDDLNGTQALSRKQGRFQTIPAVSPTCEKPVEKAADPCASFETHSALPFPVVPVEEFEALYHRYERRVYRQCFRMLRNQEDAEDLTQEVFLQLYRKLHTFRGEANFSTWLHRLTVNTVLMRLRRYRRWRESVISLDTAPGSEDSVSDALTMISTSAPPVMDGLDKIGLDIAISQLSSGYKDIFLLHDVEGYRHDEIAKLLGISEGTSKSQLHKARLRLRSLMGLKNRTKVACQSVLPLRPLARKHSRFPSTPNYAVA